jgi:hypothetical protein
LHLGRHDSRKLLPEIRSHHPASKAIIISGGLEGEVIVGADAVLEKGLDFDDLLATVRELVGA